MPLFPLDLLETPVAAPDALNANVVVGTSITFTISILDVPLSTWETAGFIGDNGVGDGDITSVVDR